MDKNLHEGHRQRLREKFKKGKELFNEHELLELLLGYSIARKDTNALAHKLIDEFGSLYNVLNAPVELLTRVEGVGETTANLLSLTGYISSIQKPSSKKVQLTNILETKEFATQLYKNADHEIFYMLYLDAKRNVIGSTKLDDGEELKVNINFDKISEGIVKHKPKSVVVLHNHFSQFPYPSEDDDKATAKIYTFLNFHKISLLDHVIVSGSEVYSYFYDNRLQNIKKMVNENIL